jgi:hypothetical protein
VRSTVRRQPGGTTVVALYSQTTSGPARRVRSSQRLTLHDADPDRPASEPRRGSAHRHAAGCRRWHLTRRRGRSAARTHAHGDDFDRPVRSACPKRRGDARGRRRARSGRTAPAARTIVRRSARRAFARAAGRAMPSRPERARRLVLERPSAAVQRRLRRIEQAHGLPRDRARRRRRAHPTRRAVPDRAARRRAGCRASSASSAACKAAGSAERPAA